VVFFLDTSQWLKRFLYHLLFILPLALSISFYTTLKNYNANHFDVFLVFYIIATLPIMFVAPIVSSMVLLPKWLFWFIPIYITVQVVLTIYFSHVLHEIIFSVQNVLVFFTIGLSIFFMLIWIVLSWLMGARIAANSNTILSLNEEIKQKNVKLQQALLVQEHKYNVLFAKSDDMLVLIDDNLIIKEVNSVFLERLNVRAEEVISKSIFDFKAHVFNQNVLGFFSKRDMNLDYTIDDFRLVNNQGATIYTKARVKFSHTVNGVSHYIAILWDVTDLRFRELRDNELMETFGMVMRHLNHNLRGPLSTAMAVNQLYSLKYKEASVSSEMCEGLSLTGKLLDKIDAQLRRSVTGLEGYEEVWMKDTQRVENGRVLILDDNKDDIILLKTIIEDVISGANVISFTESSMGLFYLENSIKQNDICFLDMEMPGISGFQIVDAILKQSLRVSSLYIVSAHSYADLVQKGFDIENYDFIKGIIKKPLEVGRISEVLQKWYSVRNAK